MSSPFIRRPHASVRTAKRGLASDRWFTRCAVVLGATMLWGCGDVPTQRAVGPQAANREAVKFWDVLASTRWNQRATDLLQGLPAGTPSNGQAWASRMLTYLSVAQYRSALAATDPSDRPTHASVSAAVASASFDVLEAFFKSEPSVPAASKLLIGAQLKQWLLDDDAAPVWPGEANQDVAAGDEIGHAVAAAVLGQAHTDGYLTAPPAFAAMVSARGIRLTDWHPGSSAIVRSLWGVTPFFLAADDFLLSPAPPAYDSPEFQTALAEVYTISSTRSPDQLAIALKWNKVPPSGPYTAGEWNRRADDLIRAHHRTEAEATRILAFANAAAFDAQIDCFMTKYTWWVRRPAQVNSAITTAFATPNHPSYPSGHSCISSAFGAVLADVFPSERDGLNAAVEEAGLSRVYAGIHYRFDIEAGQGVGRRAAAKALAGSLE
jgi:membrane-associated phospholipid phosphatase